MLKKYFPFNTKDPPVRALRLPHCRDYHSTVRDFNRLLRSEGLSFNSIDTFWKQEQRRGLAPRTLNKKRAAIKAAVLDTLESDSNLAHYAPSFDLFFRRKIKGFIPDNRINDSQQLSNAEVELLIQKLPPKLSLAFEVLSGHGLRISELIFMSLRRASLINGIYHFPVIGKGQKVRKIYLHEGLVWRIQEVFSSKEHYLFLNRFGKPISRFYVARELKKYGTAILGKRVHAHMARHYFVRFRREQGIALEKISSYLGHSSVSVTTGMYLKPQMSPEDIAGSIVPLIKLGSAEISGN